MSLLAMCQPNILYGGPGGSRTRVQNAFTLKGLQLFFYQRFFLVARRAARSIGVLFFWAMLLSVLSQLLWLNICCLQAFLTLYYVKTY